MDVSETIAPNSEQVNAEDLIGGAQTVTITGVEKGTKEQPVFIHLAEFPGRTFRPAKTVRRLIVAAWGVDSAAYIGRRLTIFNDQTVRWAGQDIGGVRVSHMSHIDGPLEVLLSVSRGKRSPFVVRPLTGEPLLAVLNAADTLEALRAAWDMATKQGKSNNPDLIAAKDARKSELTAVTADPGVTA